MTTTAIDVDILNELFDNQQKLDDVFSSLFDDDSFICGSSSLDEPSPNRNEKKSNRELHSKDHLIMDSEDIFPQKSRSLPALLLPVVLEIATIYYLVIYFS